MSTDESVSALDCSYWLNVNVSAERGRTVVLRAASGEQLVEDVVVALALLLEDHARLLQQVCAHAHTETRASHPRHAHRAARGPEPGPGGARASGWSGAYA